jgi:hypothetical protein
MAVFDPAEVLRSATGRSAIEEALEWVAADHALSEKVDEHLLLQAVIALESNEPAALEAVRRLTRRITSSDLDTAAVIFDSESIAKPDAYRAVLDLLAAKSHGRALTGVNASAVMTAQRENAFTIEALCAVAAIAYSDLLARSTDVELPARPRDHWLAPQIRAAFDVIDGVIRDTALVSIPGGQAARPLELIPAITGKDHVGGWQAVEEMRRGGIPYEVLLAQRSAGGAWLAHRNRTSGKVVQSIASQLCHELDDRNVDYRRSTAVGGDVSPTRIHELSAAGKQVGLVALGERHRPSCGVIFSIARDSGTASKNAGRLRTMPRDSELPLLLVLAGAGWAARNETADLAVAFQGWVYTERDMTDLADVIARMTTTLENTGGTTNDTSA